jgi:hypothetical protein
LKPLPLGRVRGEGSHRAVFASGSLRRRHALGRMAGHVSSR